MKLSGPQATAYFAKPDARRTGMLIYGADAMRVALKRQQVIAALVGPEGDKEMRLTRIPGSDLRKGSPLLLDAIKAQGFFPGPRVVFVEGADHYSADAIKAALAEWAEGDAQIIVTAKALKPTSPMRKMFEAHKNAYAVGIYDDPPTRAEIEQALTAAGLKQIGADGNDALQELARVLDPGDFRQTLEKIALYKLGDDTALSAGDVAACAPQSFEASLDDIIDIVVQGRTGEIGPMLSRLQSQGVNAVSLCIGTMRHFRTMHGAIANPDARVFGAKAAAISRHARAWGLAKTEQALTFLTDTDLALRSSARAPEMALMERCLIRLAMLSQR